MAGSSQDVARGKRLFAYLAPTLVNALPMAVPEANGFQRALKDPIKLQLASDVQCECVLVICALKRCVF